MYTVAAAYLGYPKVRRLTDSFIVLCEGNCFGVWSPGVPADRTCLEVRSIPRTIHMYWVHLFSPGREVDFKFFLFSFFPSSPRTSSSPLSRASLQVRRYYAENHICFSFKCALHFSFHLPKVCLGGWPNGCGHTRPPQGTLRKRQRHGGQIMGGGKSVSSTPRLIMPRWTKKRPARQQPPSFFACSPPPPIHVPPHPCSPSGKRHQFRERVWGGTTGGRPRRGLRSSQGHPSSSPAPAAYQLPKF